MNRSHRRKLLAVSIAVVLVVLAGCLSVSVETTVSEDGTIEEMNAEMEMDGFVFGMLEEEGEFEEDIREDFDDDAWGSFEYSEEQTDDGDMLISFTASDGDPDQIDELDVTIDEETDEITFVDTDGFGAIDDDALEDDDADDEMDDVIEDDFDFGFDDDFDFDDDFEDQIQFEYTVNMPGDIVETNGEIQDDGQSVTWTQEDDEGAETLEATSERGGDSDDGFGSGFGVAVGVLALGALVGTALVARTVRR